MSVTASVVMVRRRVTNLTEGRTSDLAKRMRSEDAHFIANDALPNRKLSKKEISSYYTYDTVYVY